MTRTRQKHPMLAAPSVPFGVALALVTGGPVATDPTAASDVDFFGGYLESSRKDIPRAVRAVRAGS